MFQKESHLFHLIQNQKLTGLRQHWVYEGRLLPKRVIQSNLLGKDNDVLGVVVSSLCCSDDAAVNIESADRSYGKVARGSDFLSEDTIKRERLDPTRP